MILLGRIAVAAIATDRVAWSVGQFVCRSVTIVSRAKLAEPIEMPFGSVTIVSCAKLAEPIEMPFGLWTRMGPRNQHMSYGGAHWRHLANTFEPSVCGGDASCDIFIKLL